MKGFFKMEYIKYTIFLFLLIIISCSSSQSTIYKPSDRGTGWKVNVIKKASLGGADRGGVEMKTYSLKFVNSGAALEI